MKINKNQMQILSKAEFYLPRHVVTYEQYVAVSRMKQKIENTNFE